MDALQLPVGYICTPEKLALCIRMEKLSISKQKRHFDNSLLQSQP
ncbi:hypothetical protein [Trichocoleus sp. FACHB-90]|nr:hypothetical protein [Trichocoleus sp. FACHB-90]